MTSNSPHLGKITLQERAGGISLVHLRYAPGMRLAAARPRESLRCLDSERGLMRKLSALGFFSYGRDKFYFDRQARSTVINSLRSRLPALSSKCPKHG